MDGLQHGFRVGFDHSGRLRPAHRNMPSAEQHPEVIDRYLEAELTAGRILGPFSPGSILIGQINRLGVVPKGHTSGKWRLITDLSFPEGASVNDGIDSRFCSDTEQYKLLNVKEDPIDNRQQYLDVMCFPTLFPTGKFGEHHPRAVKLSHSEHIKSRLLNKDSRFRKEPQYVFYLLWQKEMRELSAGIYNLLKCARSQPMTVSTLLNQVKTSDDALEANLCTMLQSVRGTKQYWFIRQSELRCMIREWGSPTFFLTFSCAEYEAQDITNYLRRVNNVPSS